MSHERIGDAHVFHCDSCPEVHEGDSDESFHETWSHAKREGWITFNFKGEWVHRCPACKEED